MGEMRADLRAAIAAFDQIAGAVEHGRSFCREALDDLTRPTPTPPLPAPALTEDAIIAALKADPAMAGRVVATLGFSFSNVESADFGAAASDYADRLYLGLPRRPGLQSLAVALAAASYRG